MNHFPKYIVIGQDSSGSVDTISYSDDYDDSLESFEFWSDNKLYQDTKVIWIDTETTETPIDPRG